jgi:hypothetical protein
VCDISWRCTRGDLFIALSKADQEYVTGADVLIAPHHGSISNNENW